MDNKTISINKIYLLAKLLRDLKKATPSSKIMKKYVYGQLEELLQHILSEGIDKVIDKFQKVYDYEKGLLTETEQRRLMQNES